MVSSPLVDQTIIIPLQILDKAWPVRNFDALDSTSLEVSRRAGNGETGPFWIVARQQTAGRGRLGRTWFSETGNLYSTALIPLNEFNEEVPVLALTIGLAVSDTMRDLSNGLILPGLKWPNDVRVNGAKISGILLETGRYSNGGFWLSVGIGLNLQHSPEITNYHTANLKALTGLEIGVERAIAVLDECIRRRLKQHLASGRTSILSDWMKSSDQIGQLCTAQHEGNQVQGIFDGLDAFGQMKLKQDNGHVIAITAGDVELVREKTNAARD